jgi:hypothetical protein
MMLFSLSAAAFADVACIGLSLTQTSPQSGQRAVPYDAAIALIIEDGGCFTEAIAITLDTENGELLYSDSIGADENTPLRWISPDLAADITYRLLAVSDVMEETEIFFETGATTVQGLSGTASISSMQATQNGQDMEVICSSREPSWISV